MPEPADNRSQFEDSPRGWAERWNMEIKAAQKDGERWRGQATKAIARYLDEKNDLDFDTGRLNLFHASVTTLQALLYGKTPSTEVARRFADSDDDVGRVAAEALERLLNTDIERDSDTFAQAMELALEDRLLASLGEIRMRYVVEFEDRVTPAILGDPDPLTGEQVELAPELVEQVKTFEDVETDYAHWRDVLWSPAKTYSELRWKAYRAYMPYEALVERFGQTIADLVPMKGRKHDDTEGTGVESDPWQRAEVWEIWSKEDKKVYWWVDGCDSILDVKDDPLGLDAFWPSPKPMIGNSTTSHFMPKPDYEICRVLYNQIDHLGERIGLLEEAIRVTGVYDKAATAISSMLTKGGGNQLYPVDNWAAFAERGGLKGQIDWMPLDQIVAAIDKLSQRLDGKIQLLYQISGMSDIMRGSTDPNETLGAQQIKAKFASVRVQRLQDDVARFASEAQKIRAEIISKHFDIETIIERSNILYTPDKKDAEAAAKLIKEQFFAYRVAVKPDAVAMTDFAALKQERTEFLGGISTFLPTMMQAAQAMPGSMPMMLEILKWVMAGFKGSSQIEGILDQAIEGAQKALEQPRPPRPDPRMQVEQLKAQAGMAKTKLEIQGDLALEAKKTEGKIIEQKAQAAFNPPVPPAPVQPGGMP